MAAGIEADEAMAEKVASVADEIDQSVPGIDGKPLPAASRYHRLKAIEAKANITALSERYR